MSHNIQPTKSTFNFAIRACAQIKDAELAIEILNHSINSGTAFSYMYDSTMLVANAIGRSDLALKVLKRALLEADEKRITPVKLAKKNLSNSIYSLVKSFLILEDFCQAIVDGKVDRSMISVVLEILSGSRKYWDIALEVYEKLMKQNEIGTPLDKDFTYFK